MPEIKIKQIVSFSSEDKVYKIENLLKAETYRKWKCATPGEKKVCVVLQFEKAMQIHSVHIGNEQSAFVEVLVARSSESEKDFKVLLVASSFMSPLESRNGTNANRVRMFDNEKLTQNLKEEKWDLVQLICTQPFNKTVQYGLTFVKFYSPPEEIEETDSTSQSNLSGITFGNIEMKVQEEEDIMPAGKWFLKQRNAANSTPSTSPSAIRQASSTFASTILSSNRSALPSTPTSSKTEQGSKRKLDDYDDNKSTPPAKKTESSSINTAKPKGGSTDNTNIKQSIRAPIVASPKPSLTVKPKPVYPSSSSQSRSDEQRRPKENKTQPERKKRTSEILKGVVFVLSGFQNPFRNDIREYALEMGAKYKGDWDSACCTHLVCAFVNTPKYNQVKAKGGRIVSKDWVIDCYKKKELLPWRKYMLGKYKRDTSSEEEENEEEAEESEEEYILQPKPIKLTNKAPAETNANKQNGFAKDAKAMPTPPKITPTLNDTSIFDDSTDAEVDYDADTDVDIQLSDGDTEDELLKAESLSKRSLKALTEVDNGNEKAKSVSSLETRPDTSSIPLPKLPDFFKNKIFFLYGEFKGQEKHDLQRYIAAYNGTIANYMDESVQFVVTLSKWNSNFDEALSETDSLIFVHPKWIYKCHQMEKLVPYQPHIVVPEED